MWPRLWKPLVFVVVPAAIVLAVLYVIYRFIDPIPPRHFVIAAGMAGSGYDNFARQYARIARVSPVTCVAVFERRDRSRFCPASAAVRSEPTACAGIDGASALIGCNGTGKMIAAPDAGAIKCVCD
jgi:hypothetical protein